MPNIQTGINIGKHIIEVVQLSKTLRGFQLINQGKIDLSGVAQGDLSRLQVSSYLKRLLEEKRIEPINVITSIADSKIILRYFTIPLLPPKERESAIRFEAQKYIPFKMEEVKSSFFALPEREKKKELKVVFVATKKDVLSEHLMILKESYIEPIAIETPSLALMRLLRVLNLLSKKNSTAIVYVEKTEAVITICDQEIAYFMRDFSLTPPPETVNLSGLGGSSEYDSLLREIQLSFDYHYKRFPALAIERIILVGRNGIENWQGYLEKDLKIPTVVADPGIIFGKKFILEPEISTALGLALRGFLPQDKKISLLEEEMISPEREKSPLEEKNLLTRILVWEFLLGLAIMFFVQMAMSRQTKIIQDNLTQVKKVRERAGREFADKDKQELNRIYQEWDKKKNVFACLLDKRRYLTPPLSEIPRLLPEGVWLENLRVESKTDDAGNKFIRLIMEGKVFVGKQNKSDSDLVNEFVTNIKNSPVLAPEFKKVELGFMEKNTEREFTVTCFRIVCSN